MAHLTDMEELLASIQSTQVRDYMREAMSCYMASAYRGCIVLSYIALFDDLLAKLGELGKVNKAAKAIFIEASSRKGNQDVYEGYLIDQLTAKSLLSGLDVALLGTLRTLRNKSAHPSGHKPSPEEARYVFFETISRFLSRPILTTTQLIDELVARLSNANFFPTFVPDDIKAVVMEETALLHDEAMPQLVVKLIEAVVNADSTVATNASRFLIGLALHDRPSASTALQSKLLRGKAEDTQFARVIMQAISANGALVVGLDVATVGRIRAVISKQIDDVTAALSESKLLHPASTLNAIARSMTEETFLATYKEELLKLIDKRPYSKVLLALLADRPGAFALYFPVLIGKAGSGDFYTANTFASAIDALDVPLSPIMSDEQAFQLIVAVLKAAEYGSFGAKGLEESKFSSIPALREKATAYATSNAAMAESYVAAKLGFGEPIGAFIAMYLTDEPPPPSPPPTSD